MQCGFATIWGDCQQPVDRAGWCSYHQRLVDRGSAFHEDTYYHRKVVAGLVDLTDRYITQTELDALFRGRKRSDGRRLDQWVV